MSLKTLPNGALGVIDSDDHFWAEDGNGKWYTPGGVAGVEYASLQDLEKIRGTVTPLFAANTDLAEARLVEFREDLKAAFSDRIKLRQMIFDMAKADDDRALTPGEIEVCNRLTGDDFRNQEIARQKNLLEKAAALVTAQRLAWEAEQTYVNLHRDAMDKRRDYEAAGGQS